MPLKPIRPITFGKICRAFIKSPHAQTRFTLAIAPNGKTAISASEDRTLKIWDLLSGKEVASFSGEDAFYGCAFAPDGVTVVAGDSSGRVHFLRLEGMGDLGDV